MTEVHQCPECELRFASDWELADHMARDHPSEDVEEEDEE